MYRRNIPLRRLCYSIAILCLFYAQTVLSGAGSKIPAPEGIWLTEKQDTTVKIERCGDTLCGYIDWIHPEEDQLSPSGAPLCNQKVLWDFEQSDSGGNLWVGGRIYRPDKDKHYAARIRVLKEDTIRLRGYIGLPVLGKSYTLTRVNPDEYASCKDGEASS